MEIKQTDQLNGGKKECASLWKDYEKKTHTRKYTPKQSKHICLQVGFSLIICKCDWAQYHDIKIWAWDSYVLSDTRFRPTNIVKHWNEIEK